jgi:hypothetical protein
LTLASKLMDIKSTHAASPLLEQTLKQLTSSLQASKIRVTNNDSFILAGVALATNQENRSLDSVFAIDADTPAAIAPVLTALQTGHVQKNVASLAEKLVSIFIAHLLCIKIGNTVLNLKKWLVL